MPDDTEVSDLEASRRRKLAELRQRGVNPYPNDFKPTHTAAEIHSRYGSSTREQLESDDDSVAVAGRIVGLRRMGKATFLHVQDRSGKIQVYIKRDAVGDAMYADLKDMDLGDFAGVKGTLFRTKTEELTVEAQDIRLLSKALKPLPEKWHGLVDVEARYRQRYLDLIAND